jgi:predicted DNA-binding transcriptional regulator AlpA
VSRSSTTSEPESAPRQQRCLMNVQETSHYMNVAVNTLAAWRVQERGPAYIKLGSKVVYDRDDVDAWLAANRRSTHSAA